MPRRYRLLIPEVLVAEMLEHARAEVPLECCGVLAGTLAGDEAHVTFRYGLVNEAASPTRYESEPRSLFAAAKDMRARGVEMLAIYHSHPTSEPVPSRTDLASNYYGDDVVHLIIGMMPEPPVVVAWWLLPSEYIEAQWSVV